jgi:hypothetical protein
LMLLKALKHSGQQCIYRVEKAGTTQGPLLWRRRSQKSIFIRTSPLFSTESLLVASRLSPPILHTYFQKCFQTPPDGYQERD